jgi:hypothetical protein
MNEDKQSIDHYKECNGMSEGDVQAKDHKRGKP